MDQPRLHRCLEPGVAVLVGTVDLNGTPSCCRGIALASADGLDTMTVYVPVATSQQVVANVATTKRIAVAATHPIEHVATQLKGTVLETRIARDDEAAIVRGGLDGYARILDTLGVPLRLTRSVAHWPAFAIHARVEDVFDQTPGPRAGSRLR